MPPGAAPTASAGDGRPAARTASPSRHDWPASHQEANYLFRTLTWLRSRNDGFVLVNDGATWLVPRPRYVSHEVADHSSLLAFIEKRFLGGAHLTARDLHASTLEDLFDFDAAPSAAAAVPSAPVPLPNDPGCPFAP